MHSISHLLLLVQPVFETWEMDVPHRPCAFAWRDELAIGSVFFFTKANSASCSFFLLHLLIQYLLKRVTALLLLSFRVLYLQINPTISLWNYIITCVALSRNRPDSESKSSNPDYIIDLELVASEAILVLFETADHTKSLVRVQTIVALKIYPVFILVLHQAW